MTLVLRLMRVPLNAHHENTLRRSCLGNAMRLHATTSKYAETEKQIPGLTNPPQIPSATGPEAESPKRVLKSGFEKHEIKNLSITEKEVELSLKSSLDNVTKIRGASKVSDNVRGYVFTRYFDYVRGYDKLLEKNFPSAMKVYRVFFEGVKEFFADMKRYLKITRIVSFKGIKSLNRQELELYMKMPRDMFKMAPTLIFSALPMVGYAVFPLAFMYPRVLLTSHFWNYRQKLEFQHMEFHNRLTYYLPVFRCLQEKLRYIEKHPKHKQLSIILGQLGSGTHPTVEQLMDVKSIFTEPPYNLVSLNRKHIRMLVKMHQASRGIFKRHSLYEHAFLLHYMDQAICREGDVHNMNEKALRNACLIRGLNPSNLPKEEMISWLRDWIKVSTTVKEDHLTMFLHLPIFLAYNHPNNWRVVYGGDQAFDTTPSPEDEGKH